MHNVQAPLAELRARVQTNAPLTLKQQQDVDNGRAIVDSYGNYHQFGTWRPFVKRDVVVVSLICAALLYFAA